MATKPKAKKSTTSTLAEKASFMPVSFKEFSKNPVIGTLFIALCGIGYLYIDGRNMNTEIISAQNKKISVLEVKIDKLTDRVRLSDSMMSSAQSKIKTLQELGKIK